ncbi:MAG: NrfD/PsrC family molybdoenzyme membrane anchor subunit, partial [Candidatus Zixiibacteriota bacterium]
LSDGYPWGFWIGMDILAGIALAAGGFIVAGMVHLFGKAKYHPLSRPAVLTALLGYILFIIGLAIDLGRPWMIWQVLFHWNHNSPMFEVSWCVTMYTTVLALEFLPVVFKRFGWRHLIELWHSLVPWVIVGMVSLFTMAMSGSVAWTAAVLVVLMSWELAMRAGWMPRDKQMPILLVMAGVIFSTLHQSSLGSLLLIIPHKLHPLWFTRALPILFLLSAVMIGAGMVIFETIVSARIQKRPSEFPLLKGFVRAMPYLIGLYLILKVGDIFRTGAAEHLFVITSASVGMWLELLIGGMLPLTVFMTREFQESENWVLWGAILVVAGGIINRLNTVITAVMVHAWEVYYPSWMEIAISLGVISAGILVLDFVTRNFPVYETHHAPAH